MATERLKTVKPSGGDYTSLAAAIAGEAGNLVSADEWLHIECYAMTDTAQATVIGYITSSDCHILIDVPVSERHKGVFDRNNYYYITINAATQGVITITNQSYVTVEGVQAENTIGFGTRYAFYVDSSGANVKISKCIGTSSQYAFSGHPSDVLIYNCLAPGAGIGYQVRGGSPLYNCTAVSCEVGFEDAYGSASIFNCLAANCLTAGFAIVSSPTFTLYNCASSDGTAANFAGSGNRTNQTFSFVDAANGNFALAENDTGARGHGLTDPGNGLYLDDILGNPRTAPWDIGAFQYVSGEGGEVPIGAINRYYRTLMGGQAR